MSELCISGGYNMKFSNMSPGDGSPSDSLIITEIPCPKVKIDGKAVVTTSLQWFVSGCSSNMLSTASHTIGMGSITAAQAKKSTLLKQKPLVKGDKGQCSGIFVDNTSGAFITCSCTVEIDDAGQTKVKEL
nr:hypothetical protein 9 [bacterium]